MPQSPLPPPAVHPPLADLPVLLSVPHAGRDYPHWLLLQANGGERALRSLEDPLVDSLVTTLVERGVGAVVARAPRAAVDCNRAEDEVDPLAVDVGPLRRVSPRARGGLGIVPSRTAGFGSLWRRPLSARELEDRLDQAHRPYHRAIESQLGVLIDRYGSALLLDCHSMPSPARPGPAIIVGDRHGRSAAAWLSSSALAIIRARGFSAALNEPFAGGHVIERHGRAAGPVHALQIEIDRALYSRDGGFTASAGFGRVARLIEDLAIGLGRSLIERSLPTAAE